MLWAMRRYAALLGFLLAAGPAAADEPLKGRLIGVILDTGQALLWDETTSKYALREVGEEFQGQRIIGMEKDRVQLEHATLELAHPPMVSKKAAKKMPAVIVTANGDPRMGAVGAAVTPAAAAPSQPPGLVEAAPPAPAPPFVPGKKEVITQDIPRSQIEVGLADFAQLSEEVQVQKMDGGGWRLVRVKDGCVLRKLGLRDGDVVRRVSDLPINTFDDAASVYARIRTWNHLTLAVERDGRPVTILVRII
jgi:type II secretory pathway component PulC